MKIPSQDNIQESVLDNNLSGGVSNNIINSQNNNVNKISPKKEDDSENRNGRWTKEEHTRFVKGILKYGNNWKRVKECVSTRSSAQIRSHAQKYIIKLSKKYSKINFDRNSPQNISLLNNYYQGMSDDSYDRLTKEEIEKIILNIFKNPCSKMFTFNSSDNILLDKNEAFPSKKNQDSFFDFSINENTSYQLKDNFSILGANDNSNKYENFVRSYFTNGNKDILNVISDDNPFNKSLNINNFYDSNFSFQEINNNADNYKRLNIQTQNTKESLIQQIIKDDSQKTDEKKIKELKSMNQIIKILNNDSQDELKIQFQTEKSEPPPEIKKEKIPPPTSTEPSAVLPLKECYDKEVQNMVSPNNIYEISSENQLLHSKEQNASNQQNLINYFSFFPNNLNLVLQQQYPLNPYYNYQQSILSNNNYNMNNTNNIDMEIINMNNKYLSLAQNLTQFCNYMGLYVNRPENNYPQ